MGKLHYEIEVADDAATLYLSGILSADDAFRLSGACIDLPARVLTLRLDLHAVEKVEEDAMDAIRGVLRYWRESRGGSFRLSFATERIVATYGEGRFATAPARNRVATPHAARHLSARVGTLPAAAP
jgi:ABC-type transporter Mla MlaB component